MCRDSFKLCRASSRESISPAVNSTLKLFDNIDSNADGVLEFHEVKGHLHALGYTDSDIIDAEVHSVVELFDTDADVGYLLRSTMRVILSCNNPKECGENGCLKVLHYSGHKLWRG